MSGAACHPLPNEGPPVGQFSSWRIQLDIAREMVDALRLSIPAAVASGRLAPSIEELLGAVLDKLPQPEPIAVGDQVALGGIAPAGTVLALHNEWVWVDFAPFGPPTNVRAVRLRRVEGVS